MKNPKLISKPFALNGQKNSIPENFSPSMESNQATWDQGFGSVTMIPIAAGGLPPKGQDFNGILNQISENIVHLSKGGMFKFSAEYATTINGYPKGAILQSDDETKIYQSLIDGNKINFNSASQSQVISSWKLVFIDNLLEQINEKFDKKGGVVDGNVEAKLLRLQSSSKNKRISLFPPQDDSEEAYFQYNDGVTWSGRVKIPYTADISTLYSSGNTTTDSNGFVRTGSKTALITENVTQTIGTSASNVMSQKAVTDALETKLNKSGGTINGALESRSLKVKTLEVDRSLNILPAQSNDGLAYLQYNSGATWTGRIEIPVTAGTSVLYTSGNTTTDNNGFIRTGSKTALITENVVQSVGASTSNVMSQKAVTDALLGVNQNWVDVKSQRSANTDYTNSTGKPILVCISKPGSSGVSGGLVINGVQVGALSGGDPAMTISAIVPAGGVYKYTSTNIASWVELR